MPEKQLMCEGHEELRDLVIEMKGEIKHLNLTIENFLRLYEGVDGRVRSLEIHGAKISQENAEDITAISCRLREIDVVLGNIKGQQEQASKDAAKNAGIISAIISVVGIAVGSLSKWI